MPILSGRDYCLQLPGYVLRTYGVGFFVSALLRQKQSLLALINEYFAAHGFALPGELGRAYRIASLLEFRMARLYADLARRFAAEPVAAALFQELSEEEEEHGRLMQLCRYTVAISPAIQFVPRLGDQGVRELLKRLREIRRGVDTLSLAQALVLTEELERSEINTIFDKLLRQATDEATEPFAEALYRAGEHAQSVPFRAARLREQLAV